MLASLSDSSFKQYDCCLKKWWTYCKTNSLDLYNVSIPKIICFLTELYNGGCQYGTLNSCRSALSLIIGPTLGKDDRLSRFFKGVFRLRPTQPKYNLTWDTNKVLDSLSLWLPLNDLSLEKLTYKTIMLLALATAQRVQTLSKINIKNIQISTDRIMIKIPELIKTSRPSSKQPILYLPFFNDRPSVCPAKTLISYMERTADIRKSDSLFLAIKKPHNSVGTQTLSRWLKHTLSECGIDASLFSAHSTRHAATSRARSLGVSVDTIRNTAGWSGRSQTFARFYQRLITSNNDEIALAQSIFD